MEAIILAGGFGTRLQSVVSDVPKPMAPINGRPFLYYLLKNLKQSGFSHIIFAVGYKKEFIIDYFKDEFIGMKISYSIEETPLGTGGCIKKALGLANEDYVWVLNGDTYVDFEYKDNINTFSMVLKKMEDFERYGEVKVSSSNRIISFEEKKYCNSGYINTGIYLFPKNIFNSFKIGDNFSLERDFFSNNLDKLNIKALFTEGYFIDIGIPEDYRKAFEALHD